MAEIGFQDLTKALQEATTYPIDNEKMQGGILDKEGLVELENLDEKHQVYIPDIETFLARDDIDQDAPFYGMWYTSKEGKPTKYDLEDAQEIAQDGGFLMVITQERVFVIDNDTVIFDAPHK